MGSSGIAEKHRGVHSRLRIIWQRCDGTLHTFYNSEQLLIHRSQVLIESRLQRFQLCGFLMGEGGDCA
jgi:hypothetical protein